jgi:hypothetical protein
MFYELLDNPQAREPGIVQGNAIVQFPGVVRTSHLKERVAGQPLPSGDSLIIGVGSYSRDDLKLLDDLEAAHDKWQGTWHAFVFDLTQCKSMTDIQRYAPPLVVTMQTPIVVLYRQGCPTKTAIGLCPGRQALTEAGILP